jgi:hypothetical protein
MKQFIYLLAFAFMSVNATAQTIDHNKAGTSIVNLAVNSIGNNLQITWNSDITDGENYWEVQASTNGKDFHTIGMVLGADPAHAGQYAFKQTAAKIKPAYQYFRVAHIETTNSALASNTIRFTK